MDLVVTQVAFAFFWTPLEAANAREQLLQVFR
jgi:hypothetical protein